MRSSRAYGTWRNVQAVQSFLLCVDGHLKIAGRERFSQGMLGRGINRPIGAIEITGFGELVENALVHESPLCLNKFTARSLTASLN